MKIKTTKDRQKRIALRQRKRIAGTAERPRLAVFRSNRGVQAQVIDDVRGHTLAAVNWYEPDLKDLPRMEQAKRAGELIARRAQDAGAETVIFDRGGYRYHGRVKALADGAREGGLTF